jgi:hypothetical protein
LHPQAGARQDAAQVYRNDTVLLPEQVLRASRPHELTTIYQAMDGLLSEDLGLVLDAAARNVIGNCSGRNQGRILFQCWIAIYPIALQNAL